jgi:inhibitor of KinA
MFSIEPCGDSAFILRDLDRPAWEVADALNELNLPGLIEAVPAYETVGVYVDPADFKFDFSGWKPVARIGKMPMPRIHLVPVCYELGPDYETASTQLELSAFELQKLHEEATYTCYALGFTPGFPYLGYLDERIEGLPRLAQPRLKVPKGAIGITGRQTAIYPSQSPGGWNLIGITPLEIVGEDFFPIKAGDKIKFYSISEPEYHKMKGERLEEN